MTGDVNDQITSGPSHTLGSNTEANAKIDVERATTLIERLATHVGEFDGNRKPLSGDIVAGPAAVREDGEIIGVTVMVAVARLGEGRALQGAGLAGFKARFKPAFRSGHVWMPRPIIPAAKMLEDLLRRATTQQVKAHTRAKVFEARMTDGWIIGEGDADRSGSLGLAKLDRQGYSVKRDLIEIEFLTIREEYDSGIVGGERPDDIGHAVA